jgi:hypothetical protein
MDHYGITNLIHKAPRDNPVRIPLVITVETSAINNGHRDPPRYGKAARNPVNDVHQRTIPVRDIVGAAASSYGMTGLPDVTSATK